MTRTGRNLAIIVAILAVLVFFGPLVVGGVMGPGMMGGYGPFGRGPGFYRDTVPGSGWMWGLGMGFGGLAMLAFWTLVIIGVVLLAR